MEKQYKMGAIREIIDSDENLIGNDDTPTHGSNIETMANRTSDYNQGVGHQPFRYDMLGRFGFGLMPFFEGEENQQQTKLFSDMVNIFDDYYVELLKKYIKNPNKLKSDYRRKIGEDEDIQKNENGEYAKKGMMLYQKYFEESFDETKLIDESSVKEEIVDEKENIELIDKTDNNEIISKELKKIAGLINRMDNDDKKKLSTLLEYK